MHDGCAQTLRQLQHLRYRRSASGASENRDIFGLANQKNRFSHVCGVSIDFRRSAQGGQASNLRICFRFKHFRRNIQMGDTAPAIGLSDSLMKHMGSLICIGQRLRIDADVAK